MKFRHKKTVKTVKKEIKKTEMRKGKVRVPL